MINEIDNNRNNDDNSDNYERPKDQTQSTTETARSHSVRYPTVSCSDKSNIRKRSTHPNLQQVANNFFRWLPPLIPGFQILFSVGNFSKTQDRVQQNGALEKFRLSIERIWPRP